MSQSKGLCSDASLERPVRDESTALSSDAILEKQVRDESTGQVQIPFHGHTNP